MTNWVGIEARSPTVDEVCALPSGGGDRNDLLIATACSISPDSHIAFSQAKAQKNIDMAVNYGSLLLIIPLLLFHKTIFRYLDAGIVSGAASTIRYTYGLKQRISDRAKQENER